VSSVLLRKEDLSRALLLWQPDIVYTAMPDMVKMQKNALKRFIENLTTDIFCYSAKYISKTRQ
jgi:hypothetical protein